MNTPARQSGLPDGGGRVVGYCSVHGYVSSDTALCRRGAGGPECGQPLTDVTPTRGEDANTPMPCAWCNGDGDACNPGNASADVSVWEWLPPVACPRCGGSGTDPNPGEAPRCPIPVFDGPIGEPCGRFINDDYECPYHGAEGADALDLENPNG